MRPSCSWSVTVPIRLWCPTRAAGTHLWGRASVRREKTLKEREGQGHDGWSRAMESVRRAAEAHGHVRSFRESLELELRLVRVAELRFDRVGVGADYRTSFVH